MQSRLCNDDISTSNREGKKSGEIILTIIIEENLLFA